MRNEAEVLGQILDLANRHEGIRAVLLNGSRVNPKVKLDMFCDYDVIYAVTEPYSFMQNKAWMQSFGDLLVMQQNTLDDRGGGYIFLMLFQDNLRIDLSFRSVANLESFLEDSLTKVLLDKDNKIQPLGPSNDSSYITKIPTPNEFAQTLNEFWWCSTNAAKGLWRQEMPYAKYMLDVILKGCLVQVLAWYVGSHHNWSVNTGKAGRWLESYLPNDLWQEFASTYVGSNYDEMWESLLRAGRLIGSVGIELADQLGYPSPLQDDANVMEYVQKVRSWS